MSEIRSFEEFKHAFANVRSVGSTAIGKMGNPGAKVNVQEVFLQTAEEDARVSDLIARVDNRDLTREAEELRPPA